MTMTVTSLRLLVQQHTHSSLTCTWGFGLSNIITIHCVYLCLKIYNLVKTPGWSHECWALRIEYRHMLEGEQRGHVDMFIDVLSYPTLHGTIKETFSEFSF
jgi:hypothetical protein